MVGHHVAVIDFARLPAATVHATRRALLDAYGVMLAASGLATDAAPIREQAVSEGGHPQSRLIGWDVRVPAAAAAFANGALGHALDFGDTFDAGPAHPNAALVPALLALADADPAIDGGQLIAAMAAGSDLACRISLAPARPFEDGGWYPPPFGGMIGAAAACAKLLGLNADGIVHAIGLSLCQASFPGEMKYDPSTRLRGLREAFAARSAVASAQLAARGLRSFDRPLEGKGGFFALHGGGLRADVLLDGMGERFLGDAVSFKPWPCCRGTHAYIEAALRLRPQLAGRTIDAIAVEIGPIQEMLVNPPAQKAAPTSAIDAKFSIPFTLATAIVHGDVTLDSFDATALADPAVRAIAAQVTARRHPDWGRAQAAAGTVTITLGDGERLHAAVPQAAGHPDHPLSDEALVDKFVACAARAATPLVPDHARMLADATLSIGPDQSVAAVFSAVSGQRSV